MNEHREDIQTDESVPSWERPGCFRRGCEPHHGELLWWPAYEGFCSDSLAGCLVLSVP
jgi:hypothetical protein